MSKSRSGKTPNNSQNAPPTTTQNAIIPGKFFESDWNELLEIEDDENFISDIIDEITDAACNQVYDNIIKSRVQPHTVLAARELLLDIIDWNFLQNDPGEVDTNEKLSWIEEDEPLECIIDNWAQGAVPKKDVEELDTIMEDKNRAIEVSPLPTELIDSNSKEEKDVNFIEYMLDDMNLEDSSITDGDLVEKVGNMALEDPSNLESCEDTKELSVVVDGKNDTIESSKEELPKSKKKKKYRPHVGSLPTFEKISLDSVTDLRPKPGTRIGYDVENGAEYSIKNQYGRASGPKEVVYDERGQVVKVQKLNVANFPRHRVPVRYSIVDPEKEVTQPHKKSNKKINQTAEKSIQNRNKISAKTLLQRVHPSTTWDSTAITDYGRNVNGHMEYKLQSRSPLPPLMVDSINVTDGVTIREGGLSKQVMKKSTQETSVGKRAIYPIANSMNNRILEVKDIVSETSPTFRYVGVSETLAGM